MPAVAPGKRILLVEDERKLARALQSQLQRAGYSVDSAHDGVQATELALSGGYELIVLDLNLPKKSGLAVLEDLRARSCTTPVLILSSRVDIQDKVAGLNLGADDYVVKPFDATELIARIEALLRRGDGPRTTVLKAADLTLDIVDRTVERGGKAIQLTPRQFSLLEFLLRNKNQVVTRKRIAEQVWGYTFDTGTNIVDVYISYLRKAVDEDFSPKLIQTVLRHGFVVRDD